MEGKVWRAQDAIKLIYSKMLNAWPGMNRLYLVTFIPKHHEGDSDQADSPTNLEIAIATTQSVHPTGTPAANSQGFSPPLLDPFPFPPHWGHDPTPPPCFHKAAQALIQLFGHLPDFSFSPASFSKVWAATWDSLLSAGCLENKAFLLFTPEHRLPAIRTSNSISSIPEKQPSLPVTLLPLPATPFPMKTSCLHSAPLQCPFTHAKYPFSGSLKKQPVTMYWGNLKDTIATFVFIYLFLKAFS